MARRGRPKKVNQQPKKYFIAGFFVIIALLAIFSGTRFALKFPEFSFSSVTCIDTPVTLPEKLEKDIITLVKDRSLFTLDLAPVREEILSRYPGIKEVFLIKRFPSTLRIEVEEREPVFQIKENAYFLLGRDFVVIDKSLDPFPEALVVETKHVFSGVRPGDKVNDKNISAASELIGVLAEFEDLDPEIILAHDQESFSFYTHGINIILGKGDFRSKLNTFCGLLRDKFENDFSRVRYADLRYSKVYFGTKK